VAHRNKFINIKMVVKVMGFLLIIEGFFMLTSLIFALYYHESVVPIILSSFITLVQERYSGLQVCAKLLRILAKGKAF